MICEHFIAGECTHAAAIAKYGKKPSPGGHKACPHNTTGGAWPTIETRPPPPRDPAVLANIQAQQRNCRGCGDAPLEGI